MDDALKTRLMREAQTAYSDPSAEPGQKGLADLLVKFGFDLIGFNKKFYHPLPRRLLKGDIDIVAHFQDTIFLISVKNTTTSTHTYGNANEFFTFCDGNLTEIQGLYGQQPSTAYKQIFCHLGVASAEGTEQSTPSLETNNCRILFSDDISYYDDIVKINNLMARNEFLSDVKMPPRGRTEKRTAVRYTINQVNTYLLFVSPQHLFDCVTIPRKRNRNLGLSAYQRVIDKTRLKQIADYIREPTGGLAFPNAIILASTNALDTSEIPNSEDRWGAKSVYVNFPMDYGALRVIDGQHRLLGYSYTDPLTQTEKRLQVIILENLNSSSMAKIFLDINSTMKIVDPNLRLLISHEIDRPTRFKAKNREKEIVGFVLKLIADSTLTEEKIFLGHAGVRPSRESLNLRTFVSAVKKNQLDKRGSSNEEHYLTLKNTIMQLKASQNAEFYLCNTGFRIITNILGDYFDNHVQIPLNEFLVRLSRLPDLTVLEYGEKGADNRAKALIKELKENNPDLTEL